MPIARLLREKSVHRVTIHPGEYHVAKQNMIISTLLGSCVAACLYDPVSRVTGMNHFLLANRKYMKSDPVIVSQAGRYGIHAMELLINGMLSKGAARDRLQAKAFGGASMMQVAAAGDNFPIIGEVNTRFIREFLKNEGIPLVASDLGGKIGRIVHFYSADFSVYMKRMRSDDKSRLDRKEHDYWEHCIEEHDHEQAQTDFW